MHRLFDSVKENNSIKFHIDGVVQDCNISSALATQGAKACHVDCLVPERLTPVR